MDIHLIGIIVLIIAICLTVAFDLDEIIGVPFITGTLFGLLCMLLVMYGIPDVVWWISAIIGVVTGVGFTICVRRAKQRMTSPDINIGE